MEGQAKELIPATIGIFALLLTGITTMHLVAGEKQAFNIADTRAITSEAQSRKALDTAFRESAESAALQTADDVAADLAVELKHAPSILLAHQDL